MIIFNKWMFIKVIRNRIETYFKLIVRNLSDSMLKNNGKQFNKILEDNMQIELYNQ